MAEEKENGGKKRQRSPNYPAIGLRKAVERVRDLYKEDGRPGAPLEAAVKHLGYGSAHGQAMTIVSALKKFGLVEDRNGRIIPTKLAVDIAEFKPDHPRHTEALREAVQKPEIYAELIDQYRQHGRLVSDESLRPELITDKGFNPRAVDGFIADFRDSLEYAGLLEGNTLKLSPAAPGDEEEKQEGDDVADPESKTDPKAPPSKDPGPYISFPLSGGNVIEIKVREKITASDFATVKKLIELSEPALVDPSKPEPGN
jgi:hypothetical protein